MLTFFYYGNFANDPAAERKARRSLSEYLTRDLPENKVLPAPLRNAILSRAHLNEAVSLMNLPGSMGGIEQLFAPRENTAAVRKHLLASVQADPGNGLTYQTHVKWLEAHLENDRLAKPERASLEQELAQLMEGWSRAIPEEIEPRLWLVDHLLESEQLEAARPHVEFLAASRHEDPRVRATPWKWKLLEAMWLCRRKARLAEVPDRLNDAETLWPDWLPKQWLPYLRAAWQLRGGQKDAYEEARARICQESGLERESLADACMMLGAAQQMRVAADDLKPLRAAVDRGIQQLGRIPVEDLLEAGRFFWDLHRRSFRIPHTACTEA